MVMVTVMKLWCVPVKSTTRASTGEVHCRKKTATRTKIHWVVPVNRVIVIVIVVIIIIVVM